jgi:hypothetical protein
MGISGEVPAPTPKPLLLWKQRGVTKYKRVLHVQEVVWARDHVSIHFETCPEAVQTMHTMNAMSCSLCLQVNDTMYADLGSCDPKGISGVTTEHGTHALVLSFIPRFGVVFVDKVPDADPTPEYTYKPGDHSGHPDYPLGGGVEPPKD